MLAPDKALIIRELWLRCVQGSLAAFIPPNNLTLHGPKFMEKGDIGWAGGFSGPVSAEGGGGGEGGRA